MLQSYVDLVQNESYVQVLSDKYQTLSKQQFVVAAHLLNTLKG